MAEDKKIQKKYKIAYGTIGLRFNILGFIIILFTIGDFIGRLGGLLLLIGSIFGIIGLFHKPPKEYQIQNKKKMKIASTGIRLTGVGFILYIIGFFLLCFGVKGAHIPFFKGFLLLFVGFILGIIGLSHEPRLKARISILIFILVTIGISRILIIGNRMYLFP